METRQLEQVKELINRIADYYDLPDDEEVEEMRRLTGVAWDAEDLQMLCCEYWSHHSLEETAFMMLHEHYPPVHEVDLVFWRCKPGAVLDDQAVYEKYRLGKGSLKALEALPLEEILQKINAPGGRKIPKWGGTGAAGGSTAWSRRMIGPIHTFGCLRMAGRRRYRENTRCCNSAVII